MHTHSAQWMKCVRCVARRATYSMYTVFATARSLSPSPPRFVFMHIFRLCLALQTILHLSEIGLRMDEQSDLVVKWAVVFLIVTSWALVVSEAALGFLDHRQQLNALPSLCYAAHREVVELDLDKICIFLQKSFSGSREGWSPGPVGHFGQTLTQRL